MNKKKANFIWEEMNIIKDRLQEQVSNCERVLDKKNQKYYKQDYKNHLALQIRITNNLIDDIKDLLFNIEETDFED